MNCYLSDSERKRIAQICSLVEQPDEAPRLCGLIDSRIKLVSERYRARMEDHRPRAEVSDALATLTQALDHALRAWRDCGHELRRRIVCSAEGRDQALDEHDCWIDGPLEPRLGLMHRGLPPTADEYRQAEAETIATFFPPDFDDRAKLRNLIGRLGCWSNDGDPIQCILDHIRESVVENCDVKKAVPLRENAARRQANIELATAVVRYIKTMMGFSSRDNRAPYRDVCTPALAALARTCGFAPNTDTGPTLKAALRAVNATARRT